MSKIIVAFYNFARPPKILHSSYRLLICFERFSEQTAIFFQYSTQWLVLIIEVASVCCAVRTGSLNNVVYVSPFKC
jgi:hypothetical protein